ncbi:MFS transporter [Levilactobacillus parabrevis]|uniref:Multidrug transport protein, major facilitator superfamily (Mfs) n=1 Tax=Levilactobacillus parabrevis ATCC 53295 TaxID=1267003 RepID=A0A0R1GPZ0_9LACO|nr:MFS transporter [Levilactobacillus parabrevis]KRK33458.1 multidrug transport protein, major facilitator superfamily (mfs) [Levilactobacillus parabrevis ATCC 53295]KRO06672.1 multidrug transport protein, major facilitator superfamily (mfs) [Levilactobacillus parabrevis]
MKTRLYTKDVKLVLAASFFFLMSPMLVNPIIAGFSSNVGANSVLAGVVAGMMNLTSLVLRPLAGNLTDRFSKYRLTLIGGVLILIACVGYGVTTSVPLIMVWRVVNGLGYTLCTVCMSTWMASLLPADRIGAGMGIYGIANALGMAIGPAVSVYLYHHFGYRSVFWVAAICVTLLLIIIQFVGNRSIPHPDYRKSKAQQPKFRLVQPKVIPVAVILLLFSLPYFATQTYIVSYVEHRGFAIPAGAFFPVYALVLLAMRLLLRDAFDRIPFGKFFWACLGCNLIGIIGLTDMTNWLMLAVGAVGLAAGYGLMFSICQAKSLTLVPKSDRGLANSTFYIGIDLGMTLGPMLAGVITTYLPWVSLYPMMAITLPLLVAVYWQNRRKLS